MAAVTSDKARPQARVESSDSAREAVFESLFFEYYTRVYAVVFRVVGDRAEAEDLALEAFWRLWQRAPTGADHLGGWLYRVAVRLGYNALRATRRRAHYEEQAGRDALEQNVPVDPAREAEEREDRARVRTVLAEMPAREAELLILRHSGLSYQEVALALGVRPGSIGTLLARAERRFERIYLARFRKDQAEHAP